MTAVEAAEQYLTHLTGGLEVFAAWMTKVGTAADGAGSSSEAHSL